MHPAWSARSTCTICFAPKCCEPIAHFVISDIQGRAQGIRLLVLDVDGVLTDGRLYYAEDGAELKAFHIQDGLGIKLLRGSGVEVAIITGRTSGAVTHRATNLGILHVLQGVEDKLLALQQLREGLAIDWGNIAAMGDDLPDLPILRRCGLALTVPDAPALVRRHAHYVTQRSGGAGAVREACELIMKARTTFDTSMQEFLK
jgi:3-deoxy-D-manno-octulosonate 8-phosphate phosphatase (KDO 8-P phosphatase)